MQRPSTAATGLLDQTLSLPLHRNSMSILDRNQRRTSSSGMEDDFVQCEPPPRDTIVPISGCGLNRSVNGLLYVIDRNELVFALGKYAVVQNVNSQELTFVAGQLSTPDSRQPENKCSTSRSTSVRIAGQSELGEITAMSLCGRRHHLAVCRVAIPGSSHAMVSIFTLKSARSKHQVGEINETAPINRRRRTPFDSHPPTRGAKLKTLKFETERFCSSAFSSDGKLLCCQSTNASWTVVVWDWSRERQIALADVHCKVTRVRFNIIDMAQISTSGGSQLKLWTLSEYTLKTFAAFKSGDESRVKHVASYVDHVWLPDDGLVALLDDGSVQLIINGELLQTVMALTTRAICLVPLPNSEGVIVGGDGGVLALLRIVTKMMRAGEREMHLQRRMRVASAQLIVALAIDPAGTTIVCCTESLYGSYDLSNLCHLIGDDEPVVLSPLVSTPFASHMDHLSAGSRRPCFAALCRLSSGEYAIHVWNQKDTYDCALSFHLEPTASSSSSTLLAATSSVLSPLCMDVHPSGTELLVSFHSKVLVYFILQDTMKIAFELLARQVTHLAYSPSGSHFVLAQTINKHILVYQNYDRSHREPELLGLYTGFEDTISSLTWSLNDHSFFLVGSAGMLCHYRLQILDGSDLAEFIQVHSTAQLMQKEHVVVGFACSKVERDSHNMVLFAVEKEVQLHNHSTNASRFHSSTIVSYLRAWFNGILTHDSLPPLALPHDITAVCAGPGKMLLAATASGTLLMMYWRVGSSQDSMATGLFRPVHVLSPVRQLDFHASSVSGLFYSRSTRLLLSTAHDGVVLVCTILRENENVSAAVAAQFDDVPFTEPSQTFTNIAHAEEVAIYDNNAIELRKLKMLDIEGELQQAAMENEILTKQVSEQKLRFEEQWKSEVARQVTQHEQRQSSIRDEMNAKLNAVEKSRHDQIAELNMTAQRARDQYTASAEKLHAECRQLHADLYTAQIAIEDLRYASQENELGIRTEYEAKLKDVMEAKRLSELSLNHELQKTRAKLKEVLEQLDQDQLEQLAQLSTTIECEKARSAQQMSQVQGKMAAVHQEVKMLLAALNEKDAELHEHDAKCVRQAMEIAQLKDLIRHEREQVEKATRERQEMIVIAMEQRAVQENLERLNTMHRSQIEMLQKNLIPKEKEIEQMQRHLTQLHAANQDVVVQANISDRQRMESNLKAKRQEREVEEVHQALERMRNSLLIVQDELGEVVKQSAVQEKSALVGDIMRIHKRLTRQLDAMNGGNYHGELEVSELHRQNQFLLKNKQHLRRRIELAQKEKNKLVTTLTSQNAALMAELNTIRKQKKEQERIEQPAREISRVRSPPEVGHIHVLDDKEIPVEVDGRDICPPVSQIRISIPIKVHQGLQSSRRPKSANVGKGVAMRRPKSAILR